MAVEGAGMVFLVGCLGGFLCELLHWWNLRNKPEWPAYAKWPIYWVLTLLMVLAGGAITWVYFGQKVDGLLAVHVGLTTPLLLQKLAGSLPDPSGARAILPQHSVKSFLTW
jgi:hypothetical protein